MSAVAKGSGQSVSPRLLLLTMLNTWASAREKHREETELISRAHGWLHQVSQHQSFLRSAAANSSLGGLMLGLLGGYVG